MSNTYEIMKPDNGNIITLDVVIEKKVNEELGLNIYEKYVGSGVYISNVFAESAAAEEGSLREDDHILKINGRDVDSSSQEDVAMLLKKSKGKIRFKIGRFKNPPKKSEASSYITSLLASIERESLKLEHNHHVHRSNYENDRGPNDHFVEIEKNPLQSLGISIAGGMNSPLGNIPVLITIVQPGGPASGKLEVGDKILSINGQSTDNKTHEEVVWMIKRSADAIILMKVRRGDEDVRKLVDYLTETVHSVSKLISSSLDLDLLPQTPESKPGTPEEQPAKRKVIMELTQEDVRRRMDIVLDPGKDGLGFSVVGGIGSIHGDLPLFVKSIFGEGAAAKEGQLRRGDRILAVNGESLDGCTHAEGVAILKKAKGKVVLSVIPT